MSNSVILYGGKKSRAIRVMWMLEELNLDYQTIDSNDAGEDYLALNPAGKVPTLVDGDFVLWESLAIMRYLAEKSNSALLPTTLQAKALTDQWALWAVTEVELFVTIAVREMRLGDDADQEKIQGCADSALSALNTFEAALSRGDDYLLGEEFSLADMNVASVLCFLPMINASFDNHPLTANWLGRCLARPAWQKLQA